MKYLASFGAFHLGELTKTDRNGVPALNPAHSRWLMGFPPEWDDCAATVTLSSRRKPKHSLKHILKQERNGQMATHRSEESRVLSYFRNAPPDSARLVFGLVREAMKERFGGLKAPQKAPRKPRKAPKTSAKAEGKAEGAVA